MSSQYSSKPAHDRFYGQRALFAVRPSNAGYPFRQGYDTPPASPSPTEDSKSPSGQVPPPLVEFIAYALYRTRLPLPVVHQALLLLARLKSRYPSARGTATSPHRLFLSALMLSSKIVMDDTYSNKSWAIVGGNLFSLTEVNQMERELFAFLGCNVIVQPEDLDAFVKRITEPNRAMYTTSDIVATAASGTSRASSSPKRRRSLSVRTTTTTTTTTKIAGDRHQRATDAAVALLHTQHHSYNTSLSTPPISPHIYPSKQQQHNNMLSSTPMSPSSSTSTTRSPVTPVLPHPNQHQRKMSLPVHMTSTTQVPLSSNNRMRSNRCDYFCAYPSPSHLSFSKEPLYNHQQPITTSYLDGSHHHRNMSLLTPTSPQRVQ